MTFDSEAQFAGLLIHTAYVYRRRSDGHGGVKRDRMGQPTRDEQAHHRLATRCTAASGGKQFGERMVDVVVTNHKLFLDRDADIREDDVVTVVSEPIDSAPALGDEAAISAAYKICERANVDLVAPRDDGDDRHHVEVKVSTQRQARGSLS